MPRFAKSNKHPHEQRTVQSRFTLVFQVVKLAVDSVLKLLTEELLNMMELWTSSLEYGIL